MNSPEPKIVEALQSHIAAQLNEMRSQVMPKLPQIVTDPKKMLDDALKERGVSRRDRRRLFSKKSKNRKAPRG